MSELVTKKLRPGDIYTHCCSGLRNEQDESGQTNYDGSPRPEGENRIAPKCLAELGISCEVMAGAGRPMALTTGESRFGEK
jgi:hypothetical protein